MEPNPKNLLRIRENIKINDLHNISLEGKAIGDKESHIEFTMSKGEPLSAVGSINKEFATCFSGSENESLMVEQQTLDSIITKYNVRSRIFIKIDVEYYELNVLKGAIHMLQFLKPVIMLEIILYERLVYYKPSIKGKVSEDHVEEIEKLLVGFGYYPYVILEDGIYRIDSVFNAPDTRDIIFATVSTESRFVPFNQVPDFIFER